MEDQTKDCFIGISSLPDSVGQYRLGTIFLRNFYTSLDFDKNLIMIGLNKGADAMASQISGKAGNPFKKEELLPVHYILFIVTLLVSLLIIVFFLIYRYKTQTANEGITSNRKKKTQEEIGEVIGCVNDSLVEEDVQQMM